MYSQIELTSSIVPQDSIPILKYLPEWFPGGQFKRIARKGRSLSQAIRNVPFAETKRLMVSERGYSQIVCVIDSVH